MAVQLKYLYEFGPYRLDVEKRLLLKDGEPVSLAPKAFDILLALVQGNGQVPDKEELIRRIWPDSSLEEGTLTVNISMMRKVFIESPNRQLYIATVPGCGYRSVADLSKLFDQGYELVVKERTRLRIVIEEGEKRRHETKKLADSQSAPLSFAAEANSHHWKIHRKAWLISSSIIAIVIIISYLLL